MEKINILSKYAEFNSHWSPHSIAELNGQHVLLAKVVGEFIWHSHADEDELFHVIKGKLKIEFRDKTVEIYPGEIIVVPKGIEHRPVAEEETWILLFEPINTKHTGDVIADMTKYKYPKI